MEVVVFGAAGPTGHLVCGEALAVGYRVRAVSRRLDPLPLPRSGRLVQVSADAVSGVGVPAAVEGADAVISVLGSPYRRDEIMVYSAGVRAIVEGMRAGARGRRLVVVSSGLTYPPPPMNWFADHVLFPFLRNVPGRTLYADMRRMEEYLRGCDDIEWTVMRPGRLVDRDRVSEYRVDFDHPSQGYTSRADLAAAMVAELSPNGHIRSVVAPTTRR
ncbi:NAD(P)H-binding protein [Cryobacterium sp. GrIS_2_6]|uniref:NAD(P)-dependent oxidoreductase n=1 Tax=Cryobacterium sp. GrIS_2_6 TaxID=3162785 RepID=UPI002DFC7135|nr:nucleoside-diphosphate-sugar epimerase [Cryobacterium psychrotolerans]